MRPPLNKGGDTKESLVSQSQHSAWHGEGHCAGDVASQLAPTTCSDYLRKVKGPRKVSRIKGTGSRGGETEGTREFLQKA